ncbi:MAG TPA: fatty acyl-AMP ligase, partial [Kofleriaceae bacterium]
GADAPEIASLRWLATDRVALELGESWQDPWAGDDDVAMLQYTSGSTSTPKGVVITHRNLLHNEMLIRAVAGHAEQTIGVGWLPPYHDMGLIGMLLQPLYLGATCIFMPPLAFLRRPLVWLKAISKYKGTTSPAPNFAFDLCARKVKPEDLASLDLSSWTVAFNGAEPVRKDTIERFHRTFASCGLPPTTISPCYGLAEATLIVTGVHRGSAPTYASFDAAALAAGRVVPCAADAPGSVTLVSSGRPLGDMRVVIVDPQTSAAVEQGAVGEIWISGTSVAKGYFGREEETEATFGARLANGTGPFLRSGDLGFIFEGGLFVVGRIKDLIVIRGRNIYPQDVERTLERASAAIRPGCVAAFSVDVDGEERLVVAAEVDVAKEPLAAVRQKLIGAVASEQDVQLHDVALLAPGTIPKTTSGKIQRRATRAAYLARELSHLESSG